MKVMIDAFIFFDELELLEFRLRELATVVDTFVLVESNLTHSGHQKPLYFAENKHRFQAYGDRIVHVVHEGSLEKDIDAWCRERAQRNAILQGLEQAGAKPDDYVIISDCDEVPRADLLIQIKHHGFNIFVDPQNTKYIFNLSPFSVDEYNFDNEVFGLLQEFYYYNLECVHDSSIWWQSRIATYRKLLEFGQPEIVRRLDLGKQYFGFAGWHFSFFGGPARIANKIRSYSHQEYNTDEFLDINGIDSSIVNCQDIFGRSFIKLKHVALESNTNLPHNYKMLENFNSRRDII